MNGGIKKCSLHIKRILLKLSGEVLAGKERVTVSISTR